MHLSGTKTGMFPITMTTPAPYLTRLSATMLLATPGKRVHFYQEKWFQGTSKCGEIIEIQIFSGFFNQFIKIVSKPEGIWLSDFSKPQKEIDCINFQF